jgi:diguanylate cyclase (GGDEF)-like protein
MNQHIARRGEISRLNVYAWALRVMWAVAVALSLWWNLAHLSPESAVGLWWVHGLLGFLGLGGINFGFNRLKAAHDRIITLLYTDSLTGIANRRIFLESLGGAISYAQRHQTPLSIIMADLDDFKSVNDSFGHNAGDQVLQAFATLLMENSREEDLIARWGGEEFIMMLPGASAKKANIFAERLRHRLREITFPDPGIRLTASYGVSVYQPGDSGIGLIGRADRALYEAKRLGKNQVIILEDRVKQIEEEKQRLLNFVNHLAR